MLGIEAKLVRISRILLDVESELEHRGIHVFYQITQSNHGCKATNVLRCLGCCLNVRSWLFAVVTIVWMLSLAATCHAAAFAYPYLFSGALSAAFNMMR